MLTTALTSTLLSNLVRPAATACVELFQQVRRLVRAIAHRLEVRELATFDEHMLKDIGLTRTDVLSALSEPLGRDPSVHLVARSLERQTVARRFGGGDLRRILALKAGEKAAEAPAECPAAAQPKIARAA